jgi:hypothetical protein
MAQYQVKDAHGTVVGVIEWDGVTTYNPGEGLTLEAYMPPPPADPPAVPACPPTILRSQGLQQLDKDGKLSAYTTALSSTDKLTQLLAQSPTWRRADPRLNAMANALGYDTATKVDAFFNAASKL